jgi:D-aminopeptidase
MWDAQKQARFDALRALEEAGTLTRREQKELAGMIEEIDRAEAASLQPSVEREEAECLRLEAQNADLAALLERRQALAGKLEQVLAEAKAEDDAIEEELARILSRSEAVSGATTG